LTTPGLYHVEVQAIRGGSEIGSARASFMVTEQDIELADRASSPEFMAVLAGLTADAGGKVVAPEMLPELLHEVRKQRQEQHVQYEQRWQLGDSVLDSWLFFILLASLLCVEWFLRKKWGLV
jgi:hypothetical protein